MRGRSRQLAFERGEKVVTLGDELARGARARAKIADEVDIRGAENSDRGAFIVSIYAVTTAHDRCGRRTRSTGVSDLEPGIGSITARTMTEA